MSLKETVILNFARTLPCSGHGCETVSDIIKESQVPELLQAGGPFVEFKVTYNANRPESTLEGAVNLCLSGGGSGTKTKKAKQDTFRKHLETFVKWHRTEPGGELDAEAVAALEPFLKLRCKKVKEATECIFCQTVPEKDEEFFPRCALFLTKDTTTPIWTPPCTNCNVLALRMNSDTIGERIKKKIKGEFKNIPLVDKLLKMLIESLHAMALCENGANNRALVLHRDQDYLGKGLPISVLMDSGTAPPPSEIPKRGNLRLLVPRWLDNNPRFQVHAAFIKKLADVSSPHATNGTALHKANPTTAPICHLTSNMHTPDAEGDGIDTFLIQKIYYELDSLFCDARNGKQHCSIEFAVTSLIGCVPSFGFVDERREPGENSLDSLVVSANGAKPKASVMSKLSDIFLSNANNTAVFSKRTLRVVNSQRLSLFDIMDFIHRGRVKFHCDEIVFESSMSPSDASFSFHWASAGIALLGHEAGAMLLPEDADALQVLGSVASDCIDLTKHHLKVHQEVALPLEIRCASAPGGDFFRTLRALAKPPAERRLDASNILIAIAGETDETEDSEMHRREYFLRAAPFMGVKHGFEYPVFTNKEFTTNSPFTKTIDWRHIELFSFASTVGQDADDGPEFCFMFRSKKTHPCKFTFVAENFEFEVIMRDKTFWVPPKDFDDVTELMCFGEDGIDVKIKVQNLPTVGEDGFLLVADPNTALPYYRPVNQHRFMTKQMEKSLDDAATTIGSVYEIAVGLSLFVHSLRAISAPFEFADPTTEHLRFLARRLEILMPGLNLPPVHNMEVCEACLVLLNAYFCAVASRPHLSVLGSTTFPKPRDDHTTCVKAWAAAIRADDRARVIPKTIALPLIVRFRKIIKSVTPQSKQSKKKQPISGNGDTEGWRNSKKPRA